MALKDDSDPYQHAEKDKPDSDNQMETLLSPGRGRMEHDPDHAEENDNPRHGYLYQLRKDWILPMLESRGHEGSNHQPQDCAGVDIGRKMRAADNAADPDESTQQEERNPQPREKPADDGRGCKPVDGMT